MPAIAPGGPCVRGVRAPSALTRVPHHPCATRVQTAGTGDEEENEYAPAILDQFESALEAAKVMPHKFALLEKFRSWEAGDLPTPDLVQQVEELYDQRILETGLFDDWDD